MPLTVRVGGYQYEGSSAMECARFATNDLILDAKGAWYTDEGTFKLWPTPGEETTVLVEYVYTPPALVLDSDEPTAFPAEFHPALAFYVASVYYATVEDNLELSQANEERYRVRAAELEKHRVSQETGDQTFQIGILGVTA
jgi:hypothetical protein